jgi:ferric-dicitrate binding protein FerR (iron transport regulator)
MAGRWLGAVVAAGLVVIAGLAVGHRWISTRANVNTPDAVYRADVGQRVSVTLADGSQVTLAPKSTLRVTHGFGVRSRTVALDGEAYFTVRHAGGAPFLVRAGGTSTRVLGTSFLVRRYPTDTHVRVAVTSGKVSVSAQGPQHPSLVLTAGLVGDVSDSSAVVVSGANSDDERAWTDGRLVFTYATTADVLATLSRWYGYDFHLADSTLASQHLTIVLNARSAESALGTLKLLLNVDLTFNGSSVTLTPKQTSHAWQRRQTGRRDALVPRTPEVGR